MAHQYIYTMQNLRRVHPPNKEVLKGIYLSFYPGAKIGVLGSNGSGKSTLLRIMAGVDKDFFGDAKPADGIRIGYLPQEPALDPTKNVLGNVEEAVADTKRLLNRFDEVNLKLGEDLKPDEMDKLLDEQGKLQDAIEAANGWDLDRTLEIAMDALRLPPPGRGRHQAVGRRAPARGALPHAAASAPTCCCSTSRPTTSTPRASPGSSTTCTSTRGRSSRSPTIATSSTTSPAGSSSSTAAPASPGRATTRRGWSRRRSASRARRRRSRRGSARWPASSSGCARRRARARPRRRPASPPTRSCWRRSRRSARRRSRSASRPARAWATWW